MSTKEHEEYVRSRWEWTMVGSAAPFMGFKKDDYVWQLPGIKCWQGYSSEPEAWSAAYAFTLEREKQILQVEEEIECLQLTASIAADESWAEDWQKALKRIFAREQAALAELKRGMK